MEQKDKALILIVDDNPQNLQVLGNLLRDHGYKVAAAQDGLKALEFIQNRQPDCILLDIMMPEITGVEMCQRLKADETTRDIPVIFLTGVTDPWNKARAFEAGGVDYITKPFESEDVLARVTTHLALRQMHQQLQVQNAQLQHEIRERQRAEAELQAAHDELKTKNEQLEQLNASKDKFFSIISHDLRSPFTLLLAYGELLAEKFGDYDLDDIKTYAKQIYLTSKQLYALIENLLTWSRLQRGLLEPTLQCIYLKDLVFTNITMLKAKAEQKQIRLTYDVPKDLVIYADHQMLHTILRNLFSNALKFTKAGGTVTVSAQMQENNMVAILVSDTGIGIPQKVLVRLFHIDQKVSRQGTAGEEGSGLGLILCKELAEKNGGNLLVESEEGKGSTFKLLLPTAPGEKLSNTN